MKTIITKNTYLKLKELINSNTDSFWIEIMKDNEIYYREQELKEKRELRKEKLKQINESR